MTCPSVKICISTKSSTLWQHTFFSLHPSQYGTLAHFYRLHSKEKQSNRPLNHHFWICNFLKSPTLTSLLRLWLSKYLRQTTIHSPLRSDAQRRRGNRANSTTAAMNPLCDSLKSVHLNLTPLHGKPELSFSHSLSPTFAIPFKTKSPPRQCHLTVKFSAKAMEIDMLRNKQGVYAPKQKKVVVLWDLDNKPPRGPPFEAALALKRVAEKFGEVVDLSAYANRHAFIHLPQWVVQERRERKSVDILERKGIVTPSGPYICGVCGRKCKTNLDLKKHFKQLHERERQKKLNRMKSLKGKKRQRFKERYISGNHKYNETARSLITPKIGYGLASELRRAGVYVKTVEDKPQAADWALKRQMQHSMSRGIDWLILVSDDKDFVEMLRRAREANLGTVVVGDWDRALGSHADLWVPWFGWKMGRLQRKIWCLRRGRRTRMMGCFRFRNLMVGVLGSWMGW